MHGAAAQNDGHTHDKSFRPSVVGWVPDAGVEPFDVMGGYLVWATNGLGNHLEQVVCRFP